MDENIEVIPDSDEENQNEVEVLEENGENQEEEEEEEEEEVIHVLTPLDLLKIELKSINLPLMTFCKALDVALHGGLDMGVLTELYGDKGMGKTTFCIQLCLNVQIPESMEGHGAESIFINTESSFCRKRLKVMTRRFARQCRSASTDFTLNVKTLMNSIHVIDCRTVGALEHILEELPNFLKTKKVKLIVIDSLAYVFYDCDSSFEGRVQKMYGICQELYNMMYKFNLTVVVTNNLTTRFRDNGRKYYIPFMGESWTHLPNQRIELTKQGKLRKARIVKSPKGFLEEVNYRVISAGIRD